MERDRRTRDALLEGGWRVAVIWECALRAELTEITARTLDHWLRGCEREFETGIELVAAIRGATRPPLERSCSGRQSRATARMGEDAG